MRVARRLVVAIVLAALACLSGGARARELECEVCRKVSRVVESVLVHNATSTNVFTDVATALCDYLPHTMQPACKGAATATDLRVFKCLIQEADFRTVCNDPSVALCKTPTAPFLARESCHSMAPSPRQCSSCRYTVSALQQYVNDTSLQIVQTSGSEICRFHFRTEEMKQMCRVVLNAFGDVMLRVLVSRLDAEDFCCQLGLCAIPAARPGDAVWKALDQKPTSLEEQKRKALKEATKEAAASEAST